MHNVSSQRAPGLPLTVLKKVNVQFFQTAQKPESPGDPLALDCWSSYFIRFICFIDILKISIMCVLSISGSNRHSVKHFFWGWFSLDVETLILSINIDDLNSFSIFLFNDGKITYKPNSGSYFISWIKFRKLSGIFCRPFFFAPRMYDVIIAVKITPQMKPPNISIFF